MYPSSRTARWQHRAYLFGVTALAILWAGSFGWKAISIGSRPSQATASIEGQRLDELVTRGASLPFAADVAQSVQISEIKAGSGADRLTITATAVSSAEALRIANRAAEYLAGQTDVHHADQARGALERARNETRRAREQLAAVQDSMSALVANSPKLPDALLPPQDTTAAPPRNAGPQLSIVQPPADKAPVSNPAWEEQHRELTALEAKRQELLQHMTDAHPTVRSLDQEIAAVIERLVVIPKTIAGPPADQASTPEATTPSGISRESQQVREPPPPVNSSPDPAALESLREEQRQFAEALTSQMQTLRQAEARLEECLAAERKAAEAAEQPLNLPRWHVLPATATHHVAASAPRWLVGTTLLLALGGGVAMARVGGRRLERLATRPEADRLLPIPVIGLIAPADPKAPRRSPLPRLTAQCIRRVCEATLATALIGTILLGIADFRADSGMTGQALRWSWDSLRSLTSW